MHYQRPKGTADILPGQSALWQRVEATARDILARYRYEEIRTPLFENEEVFSRSAGDTSDIVTKEMYTFEDKGGRKMALRPEGTAGVVRAYVENKLYGPEFQKPTRCITWARCFATSGRRVAANASSTKSASRPLAPKRRPSMRKPLPWGATC